MRAIGFMTFCLFPATAFAHSGHMFGSGHDLWFVGLAFAVAAIYGITRKA